MNKQARRQAIQRIDTMIRASIGYTRWKERNLRKVCDECGTIPLLECHHIYPLKRLIAFIFDSTNDEDQTAKVIITMHENNESVVSSKTLCQPCHDKLHKRKSRPANPEEAKKQAHCFSVMPRNFPESLCYSLKHKIPNSLGNISLRMTVALGWYILNGHLSGNMLTVAVKTISDKLGIKNRGTTWVKCFTNALSELTSMKILAGHSLKGKDIEIHFDPEYMKRIKTQPWFIPLEIAETKSMLELAVRIKLSYYRNFTKYKVNKFWRVGVEKLMSEEHLGIKDKRTDHFIDRLNEVCKRIDWINKVGLAKGTLTFYFRNKGAIPIHSLRSLVLG
jgi:hypothetical protein